MAALVSIWCAALAFSVLFMALTSALARAMGARIEVACLFIGPKLFDIRILSVPVRISAIPLPMAYVAFAQTGPEDQPERTHLHDLPLWRRIAIAAGPWLAILLVAAALLGPELAF